MVIALRSFLPAAVVAATLIASPAWAQMGVGTPTPDAKAALDIQAADKGLLIPRLDSAQRAAIAAPPDGLMVFQKNGRVGLWYAFGGTWFYIPDKVRSGDNLGNHTATQNLALNTTHDLLLRDGADANHGLGWYGGGKLWGTTSIDGPVLYGFNAGALGTNTGGTRVTSLYWNNAGNVGIGTTAPGTRLSITPTATEPKITLWDGGNTATHYGFGISGGQINYHVNDPGASHVFYAGGKNGDGTELLRVRGDGRVGIGINAPQASLHVVGDARITALAGTGASRLVTADANGTLQTQSPLYGPGANAPTAPTAIGTVPTSATPRAVVVNPAGTRAYVVNGNAFSGALQAFDISNPNVPPVAVGAAVAIGANPASAAVHPAGNRVYVVNTSSGTLQAFDVSNPNAAPVAVGAAVSTGGASPRDIAVNPAGTRAYVVAGSFSLQVYDISNPNVAPVAVGTGATTGAVPGGVTINPAGTRAYVVNMNSRTLQAYDISDPNVTPVAVGAPVATLTSPERVRVNPAGTRAYVIAGNSLQAFDISNPNVAPVAVGSSVATGTTPISLAVNATGTRAYVVHANTSELRTYDISNPNATPVLIGSPVATNGSSFGVALNPAGSRAYVVNFSANTLQAFTLPTPWLLTQGADGTFGSFDPTTLADNLGNHTATQNLNLAANQLVGNGGSSGLSISSGGNVGILTTSPAARLDIQGGADNDGSNDPGLLAFSWNGGGYRHFIRSRHNSNVTTSGNDLDFYLNNAGTAGGSSAAGTGNIQVMTLENNNGQARVGIGTTTPARTLDVVGTTQTTNAIVTTALTGSGANIGTAVGIGVRADGGLNLGQNTVGNTVSLGYQAGQAITSGQRDVFVGYWSGRSTTSGFENTFLGYSSGANNTTGGDNVFVGHSAGSSNSTGRWNTVVGANAGGPNSSGQNNTIVGFQSAVNSSAGNDNVFVGANSGLSNSGDNNTAIGTYSGFLAQNGSNNTAVGNSSGYWTRGNNNTALGYNAGPPNNSPLTNTTAIGANAQVTQSNSLVLGGTGTNAVSVGIGTTAPNSTLHVTGSISLAYANPSADLVLTAAHHTVRRFGGCNTITLPQPSTCAGRAYVLINSNGTGSNVALAVTASGVIYDDVTNATISSLAPNNRIEVQSDGTNWIVIGR